MNQYVGLHSSSTVGVAATISKFIHEMFEILKRISIKFDP
jgi:hypothetical protein